MHEGATYDQPLHGYMAEVHLDFPACYIKHFVHWFQQLSNLKNWMMVNHLQSFEKFIFIVSLILNSL